MWHRVLLLGWSMVLLNGCAHGGSLIDDDPIGELALIPLPVSVAGDTGHLHLTEGTRIVASAGAEPVGELLAQQLRPSTGYPFDVTDEDAAPGDIQLQLDDGEGEGTEAYRLTVSAEGVLITAPAAAGLFYGTQTLLQLLPASIESATAVDGVEWRVPMVTIEDHPRFEWRGAMLDVARHFFGVDDVKRFIDQLARYKLNRFHIHLTDDQGWRIHIDAWPDLTAIGGATAVGGGPGGFYTKADYAEIVAYAAARHIQVVPEIDMPGHINAALASYGELNPDGEPTEPYTGIDVGFSSLWLDGEITQQFVTDVLGEVAAMTPGAHLHIGGDEAAATEHDDYVAFIQQVQGIVGAQGKTLVGWEEIGNAALDAPFVAQYWRSSDDALAAAARGGQVIVSPSAHAYLDMMYDAESPIGLFWAGYTDVEDAYRWDPVIEGLTEDQILGVEACLWTETVETRDHIDYLAFPRLLGHAEIGWSAAGAGSWDEYRTRLAAHGARLDARGIAFYRSPLVDW